MPIRLDQIPGEDASTVPIQAQGDSPSQAIEGEVPRTATEQFLEPDEVLPGQVALEATGRFLGRKGRMRETASGLEKSYSAKTAQAARGFGDTANIAVEERKMISESFPRDGDSFEGRVTTERSVMDFFDKKEAFLTELINRPVGQVMKGISRFGPRYELDSVALAAKKQAQQDLDKLRATRLLYGQMYEEAAQKMPPIGATPRADQLEAIDPHVAQLQQQFPGAKITKVK